MNDLYWQIELWDGEIIKVKPDQEKIKYIQSLISKGEGSITTPTRSITIKSIKDFRQSDEYYSDQKLIEGAAQAFNEPQLTEDGAIKARWVKKSVPMRRWNNFYKHSGYRLLESGNDYVIIAYRLPIHNIDHTQVQEIDEKDQLKLARIEY